MKTSLDKQLQLHRHGWTPSCRTVFKKPLPDNSSDLFKVCQTIGIPGWLLFTYDEHKIPVCIWTDIKGSSSLLNCIIDERICGDTIFKAEKIDNMNYVISDIWLYNSIHIFNETNFQYRYDWLKLLLSMFTSYHEGVTIRLIHKSQLDNTFGIRGYEYYSDKHGSNGIFSDYQTFSVKRLKLPDCYELSNGDYLNVPTIEISRYLNKLGDTFTCKCKYNTDKFWDVIIE